MYFKDTCKVCGNTYTAHPEDKNQHYCAKCDPDDPFP